MKFLLKSLAVIVLVAAVAWPAAYATNVTFHVNLTVQTTLGNFVPGTDIVVIRGSFNGWSGNTWLLSDPESDGIYSGTFDVAPGEHQYKFVIPRETGDNWEQVPHLPGENRSVTVGATPLDLPVVYFSDIEVVPQIADVEVLFRVDMSVQVLSGNFNPPPQGSDLVVVRGNQDEIGNWGGAVALQYEQGSNHIYSAWIQFDDLALNPPIEYKFVILTNGDPNDPTPGWEPMSNNRVIQANGNEPDFIPPPNGNGFGEILPPTPYWGEIGPEDILTQDVDVIFSVDVRPLMGRIAEFGYALDVGAGADDTIWTVQSVQVTGYDDIWEWGNIPGDRFMNDNGVNGDLVAGDSVWSVLIPLPAGFRKHVIYKYGANELDAEAGFARNHEWDLDDTNPVYRIPTDCWGNQDTSYVQWPCLLASVDDGVTGVPGAFVLEQNYPNPFNPSTTIGFVLPRADAMSLKVTDILGRVVSERNLGRLQAGHHTVSFNASSLASGLYFYTVSSPNFTATRKMLLMK